MTSIIGRRARATAARTGQSEVRRRRLQDDGGNKSSSLLYDKELHRALEAVSFVAVHLKNDDEYAEVGDGHFLFKILHFVVIVCKLTYAVLIKLSIK